MKCSKCKTNEITNHRIYCTDCKNAIDLKSYHKNKEKRLLYSKQYKENNPEFVEKQKKQVQEWFKTNPNYMNNWMKEKRKNNKIFQIQHHLSTQINTYLNKQNFIKNKNSLKIVGLENWELLKEHLEKQFTEGMNWDNWGIGKDNSAWHIDHIIPASSATTEEEVYKLNHYTNLRPMWCSDNIRKSNKL
jgi:hypothetical protein